MELFIFARFHAREGAAETAAKALRLQIGRVRAEPGCQSIDVFRSTRDPRLFYIHSCWAGEAAFEVHAALPGTTRFLKEMESLIDHPLDVTRARPVE